MSGRGAGRARRRAPRPSFLLAIGVSAIVTAALLFLFRGPLQQAAAFPLAWIAWILRSASIVLGQRIIWGVFVCAFAVIAFQSLRALRDAAPALPPQPQGEEGRTRVKHWEGVLALDQGSAAARHVLVLELRQAALTVLAHTEGGETDALEQRIVNGKIDIPACVRDLFGQSYMEELQDRRYRGRVPLVPLPVEEIARALEDRLGGIQADAGREK